MNATVSRPPWKYAQLRWYESSGIHWIEIPRRAGFDYVIRCARTLSVVNGVRVDVRLYG